jgi:hypothetical protein
MAGFKRLNLMLAKTQASLGTKQATLTPSGDGTSCGAEWSMDFVQETTPIDLANSTFGQFQSIVGGAYADIKLTAPIIPTGTAVLPSVDMFLTASGMARADSGNQRTYTPSSDTTAWKDLTVWKYDGEKTTGKCLLTRAHSAMFDFTVKGSLGGPCMVDFSGRAAVDTTCTPTSYPAGGLNSPASMVVPTIKATDMTVCGLSLKLLDFEIVMGNTLTLIKDMSLQYGYSGTQITDRKSNWKVRAYAINPDVGNPYASMDSTAVNTNLGLFQITFGTSADKRVRLYSGANKCQITDIKQADEDGINIWEISGIFKDNDWGLVINLA